MRNHYGQNNSTRVYFMCFQYVKKNRGVLSILTGVDNVEGWF